MPGIALFASALVLLGCVGALPAPSPEPASPILEDRASKPTVSLGPSATVIGTSGTIESFNGIPFAQPPLGPLRLKPPVAYDVNKLGTFDATGTAAACPQFFSSTSGNDLLTQVLGDLVNSPLFQTVTDQSEDCLTVDVVRPTGTKAGDNLPVLFWIYGGGFELGWTSMYSPDSLLSNAISAGKPFVFVAVNYRVGGFGFLAGKEILADGSANIGLLDQRMGLQWAADHVAAFGGDPTKVTIWGESAGAISVFDHMLLYNGNNTYKGRPLFRGAIMNSGSVIPADPVDCPRAQQVYDTVVKAGGCSSSSNTLDCLRGLPFETFLDAANSVPGILSYQSVALSYVPRPDGVVLTASPDVLVAQGHYAAVPMIIGDQEDEGTLFSLFQSNITTTDKLVDYLNTVFFHDATRSQIATLVATYDDIISAGSPFRTGILNEIYPEFKRLAAILGDLVFTLSRRAMLTAATTINPSVPAWSYLASYDYGTPILGTFHGSDLLQVFYGLLPDYASGAIQKYYFNFVYNLDPNDSSGGVSGKSSAVTMSWPLWKTNKQLVQFFNDNGALLKDDFRSDSYNYIASNIDIFHI